MKRVGVGKRAFLSREGLRPSLECMWSEGHLYSRLVLLSPLANVAKPAILGYGTVGVSNYSFSCFQGLWFSLFVKVKNSTCKRLVDNEITWKCSIDNNIWLVATDRNCCLLEFLVRRPLKDVGKSDNNLTLAESSYVEALDFPKWMGKPQNHVNYKFGGL